MPAESSVSTRAPFATAGVWLRRLAVTAATLATVPLLLPPETSPSGLAPALDAVHGAWRYLTTGLLAGAVALAMTLAWSRGERGGRDLAVFLAGAALTVAIVIANPGTLLAGAGGRLELTGLDPLVLGVWILATAGYLRFAVSFPRPATLEAVTRAMAFGRPDRAPAPSRSVRAVWWTLHRAWAIAAAVLAVIGLAWALQNGPLGAAAVFLVVGGANVLLIVAIALLPRIHEKAEGRAKRQTMWVALGVYWGLIAFPVLAILTNLIAGSLLAGAAREAWLAAGGVAGTILATGGYVFLACLAIALFADGAFDPRLALRRSVVYGGLGVLLLFVFTIVEQAAQTLVLARIGVSSQASAWVGGAVVALAFGPLRSGLERAAARWLEPAATAPPAVDWRSRDAVTEDA